MTEDVWFALKYWDPTILFVITSSSDTTLSIDELIRKKKFWVFYAYWTNMWDTPYDPIWWSDMVMHSLLNWNTRVYVFCDHCVFVGHSIHKCWKLKGKILRSTWLNNILFELQKWKEKCTSFWAELDVMLFAIEYVNKNNCRKCRKFRLETD